MQIPASQFPSPLSADENGVIGFTRDLNVNMLIDAYYHGIFPWPYEESTVLWSAPRMRGVLPLDEFHIQHSFRYEMKKLHFEFRVNTAFDKVIDACAEQPRPGQDGTWITKKIRRVYKEFHQEGFAHSFETFDNEGNLVGGLYGVSIGGIFCGESMFHHKTGASKFALVNAVNLFRQCGIKLIDTQMVTPATELFGAREIPSAEYLKLLEQYRAEPVDFTKALMNAKQSYHALF